MSLTSNKPRSLMHSAMRIVLGLLTLAFFAATVAGLTIWYLRANRVTATAIFRVSVLNPAMVADESSQRRDERNYEIVKKSQLAALKSFYLLTAALRDPGIASLSTFASVDDPEEWLEENLEVEYPQDGEYLAISLSGPESQSDDLVLILDAVANAYRNEVVYKEKERQLAQRDLLDSKLEQLNKDISRKRIELYEIANWIRFGERDNGDAWDQSGVIILDQIDPRPMRQKHGAFDPEATDTLDSTDFDKRLLDKLDKQPHIEQKVLSPGHKINEYTALKHDLMASEKIAVELTEKLKRLDMEVEMPPRIELVQPAVIDD